MLSRLEENLSSYPVMTPFGCEGGCHTTVVHSRSTILGKPGAGGEGRGGEGRGGEGSRGRGRIGDGKGRNSGLIPR